MTGRKGIKGDEGLPGFPGEKGRCGMEGPPGPPGMEGRPGPVGDIGDQGPDGIPGYSPEFPGSKGEPGEKGYSGIPGLPGKDGAPGFRGLDGLPGPQGDSGAVGRTGRPGERGDAGIAGLPGIDGRNGTIGIKGLPGNPGRPAPHSRGPPHRGFFYTIHSQSDMIPQCPHGSSLMWTGYSLLHFMGDAKAHGQDLGAPGSCLRYFSTMPFLFCSMNNVCNYASRSDYSYWLSTTEEMSITMAPIKAQNMEKYISRCSVCESATRVIALHSQSMSVPACPRQWEELWVGYSFLMHTDAGAEGGGQSLVSPGSCLREFRSSPFIECHGDGKCNYFPSAFSYWLATVDQRNMFRRPDQQTLKRGMLETRISRCIVCIRSRPYRRSP